MNQLASDRGAGLRIDPRRGQRGRARPRRHVRVGGRGPAHEGRDARYIETMRDVEGIGRGLDALRAARKPVLICAPEGRSEAARRSIVAHTGALAGNTALRDAWLRGHGAVLVEDPVTMFEAARAPVVRHEAADRRAWRPRCSPAARARCSPRPRARRGCPLPEFSAGTKRTLRKALPHYASQNNPLDVTGQAAVETEMFVGALAALAHDPAVGLVAFDAFPPRLRGRGPRGPSRCCRPRDGCGRRPAWCSRRSR